MMAFEPVYDKPIWKSQQDEVEWLKRKKMSEKVKKYPSVKEMLEEQLAEVNNEIEILRAQLISKRSIRMNLDSRIKELEQQEAGQIAMCVDDREDHIDYGC